ncbi:DUF4136 domain-containing protein [uncultured Desulfosarcina sp.]|uniref:DUF4136 domain-containing protein n=1 Tax=uncultured Desulfosarcina sp. TaxID=218289 RepID=UPI0029C62A50|nr:DUF4136 domain-containing protein [uncultured Desulfosarcina sp.]
MKYTWIITLAVVLIAGCSGIQVSQDYDPATGFGSLQSFRWEAKVQESTGDPRLDNPLRDSRIRSAVERVLKEKGFAASEGEESAFLVRYRDVLNKKLESAGGIGFGIGSYGRHGGVAIGTGNNLRETEDASLIIDFLDPESKALLWRGTGTQRFKEYDDPTKASRDINQLVEKILDQFPPKT